MIEALKSEEIVEKVGGRFKLCALIQRRLVQLMDGARPMVDRGTRSELEIVIDEILQGKIGADFGPPEPGEQLPPPRPRSRRLPREADRD